MGIRRTWRIALCGASLAIAYSQVGCKQRQFHDGTSGSDAKTFQQEMSKLRGKVFGIGANEVTLTLDDGPSVYSVAIAKYLRKKGVPTTFFFNQRNSSNLGDAGWREEVRKICAMNYHIVASHDDRHDVLNDGGRTWSTMDEIDKTIRELCPQQDYLFFRAPGGGWYQDADRLNNTDDPARPGKKLADRYIGPVFWNCDGEDWRKGTPSEVLGRYLDLLDSSYCPNSGVMLAHDLHESTVKMLVGAVGGNESSTWAAFRSDPEGNFDDSKGLIAMMQKRGIRFVALDRDEAKITELLGRKPTFRSGGAQDGGDTPPPTPPPPPPSPAPVLGKAKALVDTMLKKKNVQSADLPESEKCLLKKDLAIGYSAKQDGGSGHTEISVDIRSVGCPDAFWATPQVFLYTQHFSFIEPRTCTIQAPDGVGNVRSTPDTSVSTNIIGKVSNGTVVNIEGIEGSFYKTVFEGREGYIHMSVTASPCGT